MADRPRKTRRSPAQREREFWPSMNDFFSASPYTIMRRIADEEGTDLFDLAEPWPALEVARRSGRVVVTVELPGVDRESVNIETTEGGLVIEGEKSREVEEEGEPAEFLHAERIFGSFRRLILLPEGCDFARAQASFRDGVLRIEIPAPGAPRASRQISID